MLTETQVKVILILLDDMGHSERNLAKHLKMSDSNLSPILKKLMKVGIISRGEVRESTNGHKKEGKYMEFPYYLPKNLNALKTIIGEIAENKKIHGTGFILELIRESKYKKALIEKFKDEEVNKSILEELRKSYTPYLDLTTPTLCESYFEKGPSSGLELWYHNYLRSLSEEP